MGVNRNWPWTAWVQRRFAKPVVSGSIPATASIFRPLYNQRWMSRGHRFQLGQRVGNWLLSGGGAFWAGVKQASYRPGAQPMDAARAEKLLMEKHTELINALHDLSVLREKHMTVSKELSALKRAAKARETMKMPPPPDVAQVAGEICPDCHRPLARTEAEVTDGDTCPMGVFGGTSAASSDCRKAALRGVVEGK